MTKYIAFGYKFGTQDIDEVLGTCDEEMVPENSENFTEKMEDVTLPDWIFRGKTLPMRVYRSLGFPAVAYYRIPGT